MTATDGIAQVSTLASHTALSAWGIASAFLAVIIVSAVLFLFAWYVGRGPFVALLLSLYGAYALYTVFPFMTSVPNTPALTGLIAHLGLYAALAFVFFLVLRRVIVSDFLYIGIFGLIALSVLGAGFLFALAYQVFPVTDVYHFTPSIDALFAPQQYLFWWIAAPLAGLFIWAR